MSKEGVTKIPGLDERIENLPAFIKITLGLRNYIRVILLITLASFAYSKFKPPKPVVESIVCLADASKDRELECLLDRYHEIVAASMLPSNFGRSCAGNFPYLKRLSSTRDVVEARDNRVFRPLGLMTPSGEALVEWGEQPYSDGLGSPINTVSQTVRSSTLLALDEKKLTSAVENADHLREIAK